MAIVCYVCLTCFDGVVGDNAKPYFQTKEISDDVERATPHCKFE